MDKKTTAKATATKSKVKAPTTKKRATTKKSPVTEKATEPAKKRGRPPRQDISTRQFEELCKMQCTQREICAILDCDDKTLSRWCIRTYGLKYADAYNKYADFGKKNLRHIQFRMAESGSERMAIWLGKQYLGQSDKQDIAIAEIDDGTRAAVEDFLNDNEPNQDPQ